VEIRDWKGSDPGSWRVAVLLPGAGYTVRMPLLHWTATALVEAGWRVRTAHWSREETTPDPQGLAERAAAQGFEDTAPWAVRLLVAKSMGTLAASWAAREGVAGAWLTPLMTRSEVLAPLLAARQPALLVGGTADPLWQRPPSIPVGCRIVEIPDADHGLQVEGRWQASMDAHRQAVDAVVAFGEQVAQADAAAGSDRPRGAAEG